MAVREELVSSAVTFLQDPSVATAPLDKRIAFLQSKNLTQEEIDVSLSRAGEGGAVSRAPSGQNNYGYQQQQSWQQAPQYGYGSYQGWQQPPPEVPRRDWRDYFIMATVMSGLSYGVYFVAKRYIVPLIAPPTPPLLEQDKSSIDEAFTRAFSLIEQLSIDTASIKASEEARKERLDTALTEVEAAVQELKNSSRRRDDDSRRISDEVRALQNMIPKAMKVQEESTDGRLRELNTELKSLKTLIANRMGSPGIGAAAATAQRPSTASGVSGANMFGPSGTTNVMGGGSSLATPTDATTATPATGATDAGPGTPPEKSTPSTPFSPYARLPAGRGGIPAWQLAAAKKAEAQQVGEKQNVAESGTAVDGDGASSNATT